MNGMPAHYSDNPPILIPSARETCDDEYMPIPGHEVESMLAGVLKKMAKKHAELGNSQAAYLLRCTAEKCLKRVF